MEQTFGERLRTIRKRRGMTQSDLAQALGVTVQTVVRYESLPKEVKPARLEALAEALGVEVWELTGGEDAGETEISALTRGLRSMDSESRKKLISLMMPFIEQYQRKGAGGDGEDPSA